MSGIKRFVGTGWHQMSFRQQLVLVFCVGIVLSALTSSTIITISTSQTFRDRFILEGQRAVETLAAQSALALLYHSPDNGLDYAEMVLRSPDVTGVAIVDLSGTPLLALGTASDVLDTEFGDVRETISAELGNAWLFTAPVYTNPVPELSSESPFAVNPAPPELLGYAVVVMGKTTLREISGEIMTTNLLISSTLAIGLLACLLFITSRVTRPVRMLAETMRRATSGERQIRAEVGGPRDVAEMQQAFNAMMEVLNAGEAKLKSARDAALESARIKGEFAATVSHELRTPLNGVLGMLELLKDMGLTDKQAEYVEVARSSGETLLALINDILDFSRNDSGGGESVKDDFELRMVLDDTVGLIGSEARRKGLELGFIIAEGVPDALHGDGRRLRQVLLNLVGNAVKFTESGEVRISVSSSEDREGFLYFEVTDTGIGIPPNGHEYIFEPFRQLDGSTTRRYGGTGLGLAICRQLVELSGGNIGVRSQEGAGSTFWFTLPLRAALQPVAPLVPADSALRDRHVVVAKADGISREQIVQTCQYWGMHVTTIPSARRLIDRLREQGAPAIDLILLDDALPDEDGLPFDALARTIGNLTSAPVVLLSEQTNVSHPEILRVTGSIEKPVRIALLHKRLAEALHSARISEDAQKQRDLPSQASVLVVEDNRANQIVVAGMLERLGLQTALASGGHEAIELLRQQRFDLILMDCNMPDMDGFQTTATIRGMTDNPASRTPIIAMTANVQEGDAERCLAAGMDDYLPKPLKLSALRDKLSGWIDRRGGVESGNSRTPAVSAPPDPPRLDEAFLEDLRATLGSSFCRMLAVFREDLPSYLDALRQGLDTGSAERVLSVAHTIKGSAANIGALRLAEVCKRIEASAGHGDLDTASELYALASTEGTELLRLLEHYGSSEQSDRERDSSPQPACILVADDDRATRFALRNVLEEEGYVVIEAQDGSRAIDRCRERTPDLILMDARMPVMDGFAACQFIKEHEEYAHIPVLIITGLEDDDSIERAFAVGATDYVSKPLNFSVLRRRIAHLMHASRAEHTMRRLAYHDSLTGLPNRVYFTNQLNRLLHKRRERGESVAVMFIDVDRFKLINDTLGHDAGDMLLKIVAERVSGAVRENDLVARLGGDEFTIIIDNVDSREVLAMIARKICQAFTRPVAFLDREIFITLSIGISVFPHDATDLASLMKHADTAMFHAKRYRNDFRFFEDDMAADVSRRLELENDLRRAIERNELVVYYQPQAYAANGEVVGMEALVRWRHPRRGLVSPLDFIPLAEEIGLIDAIGEIVLRTACRQLRTWLDRGYGPLRLAVNISGRQLEKREIISMVSDALIASQIPSNHLELEITESVIMEHAEDMIEVFRRFKDMDLQIAIDDFGTGYSSLAYLKRFPVDTIKIDRSFVRGIPADQEDVAIVTGVIAMARGLGLKVVAEGVESHEQLAFLRDRGCDYIQGFHISEPLSADEFERRFLVPRLVARTGDNKVTAFKPKS